MRTTAAHRRDDVETSVMAAEKILPHVSDLQRLILKVIRQHYRETGEGMTDGEVERREEFKRWGYSSVRKRMGELRDAGYLRWTDEIRGRMKVSEPVPVTELVAKKQAEAQGRLF